AGDDLLLERHVAGQCVDEPAHAQRVLVVNRHPPLEVADVQAVRPQADPSGGPQFVLLGRVLADAPVDEPVVEFVEAEPAVGGRAGPVFAAQHLGPVVMQPLEVDRVDRVLLALEPVARDLGDRYLLVAPRVEAVPVRQFRRRVRAEVRPQQASLFLHRVGVDADLVAEAPLGVPCLLERLVQAPAGVLEEPAVVVAAQAAVFHEAVRHVRAPVRTVPVDEAVVPAPVPEQREVLAEEPDRLYVLLLELRGARDRMPVTPQQFSHRRSPACFAQEAVSLITQHGSILARMRKTGKSWLIRSKSSSGACLATGMCGRAPGAACRYRRRMGARSGPLTSSRRTCSRRPCTRTAAPWAARTLRTQLASSPSMETRYRPPS